MFTRFQRSQDRCLLPVLLYTDQSPRTALRSLKHAFQAMSVERHRLACGVQNKVAAFPILTRLILTWLNMVIKGSAPSIERKLAKLPTSSQQFAHALTASQLLLSSQTFLRHGPLTPGIEGRGLLCRGGHCVGPTQDVGNLCCSCSGCTISHTIFCPAVPPPPDPPCQPLAFQKWYQLLLIHVEARDSSDVFWAPHNRPGDVQLLRTLGQGRFGLVRLVC
jgi:hypothetical protein